MGITGRPVSGRTWKTAQKPSRKQVLDGTVTLGKDWDKKVQERQKRKLVKEKELELKEEMKAKREARAHAAAERLPLLARPPPRTAACHQDAPQARRCENHST
jgi:hypothetical protein